MEKNENNILNLCFFKLFDLTNCKVKTFYFIEITIESVVRSENLSADLKMFGFENFIF